MEKRRRGGVELVLRVIIESATRSGYMIDIAAILEVQKPDEVEIAGFCRLNFVAKDACVNLVDGVLEYSTLSAVLAKVKNLSGKDDQHCYIYMTTKEGGVIHSRQADELQESIACYSSVYASLFSRDVQSYESISKLSWRLS